MSAAISTADSIVDWEQTDLCRFLALAFGPPTRECFELLSQPGMPESLLSLWRELKCEGAFPGFEWFATYEAYESTYIALFDVGVPQPPVPLFESAHDKTRPAQEIALENTFFYEVLQLKSDPARAVPDYLVTQLEFLAALRYVRDHATEEAAVTQMLRLESDFTERHLRNWIPAAQRKLEKTGAHQFSVLMHLLVRFISNAASPVNGIRSASNHQPG